MRLARRSRAPKDRKNEQRSRARVNDNLADYLVPVNADIGELEVIMVPEEDSKVNPLGVKGIGELAKPDRAVRR